MPVLELSVASLNHVGPPLHAGVKRTARILSQVIKELRNALLNTLCGS